MMFITINISWISNLCVVKNFFNKEGYMVKKVGLLSIQASVIVSENNYCYQILLHTHKVSIKLLAHQGYMHMRVCMHTIFDTE